MAKVRTASPVKAFERELGPAKNWKGKCFAMASQAVKKKLVPRGSIAVYGHWTGPVHKSSMFAGKPVIQHGWVLLPDGRVCDPTRWVFEHVTPYIYFGPADHYDEGGNKHRTAIAGPPPRYDEEFRAYHITKAVLPSKAWKFVERLLRLDEALDEGRDIDLVTANQLQWLANRSPQELGEHAPAIYAAMDKIGLAGFVPYDNRKMVERLTKKAG